MKIPRLANELKHLPWYMLVLWAMVFLTIGMTCLAVLQTIGYLQ